MQRWVWHGPCSRSAHNQAEEITRNISFLPYMRRTFLHKWGWSAQYPNRMVPKSWPYEATKKKERKDVFGFFFSPRKLMGRIFSTKFLSVFKKLTCTLNNIFISKLLSSCNRIHCASISWYSPGSTWTGLNTILLTHFDPEWTVCLRIEQMPFSWHKPIICMVLVVVITDHLKSLIN